jgi:primosomal protein N' (replication factor Y) (superfamily II helicase)
MNHPFANVAVPFPLPQLFTYSIPNDLKNNISIGSLVVVQFGKNKVTGIVFNFSDVFSGKNLKPILDVIGIDPIVSTNNVRLTQWMTEYYAAPIGEVVKLFLSPGTYHSGIRIVSLVKKSNDDKHLSKFSSSQKRILDLLKQQNDLSISQIQKKSGIKNIYSILGGLIEAHIITLNDSATNTPKPKKQWFFNILSFDHNIQFRGSAQSNSLEAIKSLPNGNLISVKPFLRDNKSSLSTLRSLEKKGIISLHQKEIERKSDVKIDEHTLKGLSIVLNNDQKDALQVIIKSVDTNRHQTLLLHGITGSGKTQVYIEAIRHVLQSNKSTIVLVPEISLTPQTVRRFQLHFGDLVIWIHSKMSAGERYDAWRYSRKGKYKIVIGPRSALFVPMQNVGLIIVDEEHDSSYKQFDTVPRYNARDVAIIKGSIENAVVVLGSATPSIESYTNALSGKYHLLSLPIRADNAVLPPITIVNMVDERKRRYEAMKKEAKTIGQKAFQDASRSISKLLETKIRDRIIKKEGIILLQNRRGFAPFMECNDCGYIEQCDNCSVTLTYHAPQKHLRCHYCGKVKALPTQCPHCAGFTLVLHGYGTQRVEEELSLLFPDAKILRMDLDTTTKKDSHDRILQQFGEGKADILLGTQMVAKGLDFPRVTLVGVISADTQMMLPDFRSAERTFQLLTQVAGRAGRSSLLGEVIIQTSKPDHYALAHVKDHNFISFYKEEIEYRQSLNYPPFSRIIVVEVKGVKENKVEDVAVALGRKFIVSLKGSTMLGPSPAVLSKIKKEFRWQIIIKVDKEKDKNSSASRATVTKIVQEFHKSSISSGVKILIDIDPVSIM